MSPGKVRLRNLRSAERKRVRCELLQALEHIHRRKDFPLFVDLLTESEQIMLSRRIRIAKMLMMGMSAREIGSSCSAGLPTIRSIDRWLRSRFDDYRETLSTLYAILQEDVRKERRQRPIIPHSFRSLRRKYPLHFLIFNILLDDLEWGAKEISPAIPYRPRRW
jgi:uncharacterized protein YerC